MLVAGMVQALPAAAAYTSPGAMVGAGDRAGGTQLSFTAGDHVQAQVDVGTGDLLVTTDDLRLPGVSSDVSLGMAYNSLSIGTGAPQAQASSAAGYGWTQLVGWGVALFPQAGGSVIYQGPTGVTGTFAVASGTGTSTVYTSPAGIKQTLAQTASGYTLSDHSSGQVMTFTTAGVLTSVADRNGNTTTIASSGGVPTSFTSSRGPAVTRTVAVTSSGGEITKLTQTSGSSSRSFTYGYTNGFLTYTIDANGRKTEYSYGGASGQLLTEIVAPGNVDTQFGYDSSNRVTSITQVNTTAGEPGNSVTNLTYQSGSTLVYEPDQGTSGTPDTYTLTADGTKHVASVVDAGGRTRAVTYNANFDALSAATGASGSTQSMTTNTYGANGSESLTKTATGAGASDQYGYANTGAQTKYEATSATDDAGNQSLYTYNGAGNQLTAADAAGDQTTLTYNPDGTVATATAPGNGSNATSYGYDTSHDLTSITPPTGTTLGKQTLTYDDFGRVASVTDGRGKTSNYGYDSGDRLVDVYQHGTSSPPDVAYTYTDAGQVATEADPNGTTTYTYDQMGRLTSAVDSVDGVKTSYTYDKSSNLATTTTAAGTTSYGYDASNNLTSMTGAGGGATANNYFFGYDDHNRRTDTWMGGTSPTSTTWTAHQHTAYDTSGRITAVTGEKKTSTAAPSAATGVVGLTYCYAAGSTTPASCSSAASSDRSLVQSMANTVTGQVTTYTYDGAGRLTGAAITAGTAPGGAALAAVKYAYTYDARGNRTSAATTTGTGASASTTTQTLAYNAANEITTAGYSYDGAGDLTADPGVGTMGYSNGGQMTSVVKAGTIYAYSYASDTQDRLLGEATPQGSYGLSYGRDDATGRPVIEAATWSGAPGASAHLANDESGTPVGLTTTAGGQGMYVYDAQGSPIALITSGANTSFTYSFDPYGVATQTSTTSGDLSAQETPFLYTGGVNDRTTGWTKDGNRYYSSTVGRWTQRDTLDAPLDAADANRYAYAADNPINHIDPTGQSLLGCLSSEVAAAGSGVLFAASLAAEAPSALADTAVTIGSGLVFVSSIGFIADQCDGLF